MEPRDITPEKLRRTLEHRLPRKSTSSSVLVPLLHNHGEWHVLFEVRSNTVSQPGEVSFPGGHVEHNESSLEAVLRETCEETGIQASDVQILGGLPRERIQGGRLVRPFVGQIPAESLRHLKTSSEVDALFTVPVDYFMSIEPKQYRYKLEIPEDRSLPPILQRHLSVENPYGITLYWEYRGYGIWGLTARILHNLLYLIQNYQE
jgi:8-oxo-dGTP pyrophosphatase MutT (NUDIX family)